MPFLRLVESIESSNIYSVKDSAAHVEVSREVESRGSIKFRQRLCIAYNKKFCDFPLSFRAIPRAFAEVPCRFRSLLSGRKIPTLNFLAQEFMVAHRGNLPQQKMPTQVFDLLSFSYFWTYRLTRFFLEARRLIEER